MATPSGGQYCHHASHLSLREGETGERGPPGTTSSLSQFVPLPRVSTDHEIVWAEPQFQEEPLKDLSQAASGTNTACQGDYVAEGKPQWKWARRE